VGVPTMGTLSFEYIWARVRSCARDDPFLDYASSIWYGYFLCVSLLVSVI
jgi:hypothetical protein